MPVPARPFLLTLMLSSACILAFTQDQEWELKKEEEGIQVFLRKIEQSKIKEVRIVMEVGASLSAIVAVLRDPDAYVNWVYKCSESRLLGEGGQKSCMYYSRIDFPWPLPDRDLVARSSLVQDPDTRQVVIRSVAAPAAMPEVDQAIRISRLESRWILTPLENGKVRMENRIWSDPGGSLPAWLINMAVDKGPTQTMARLRDRLKDQKYLSARVDYIKH